MDVFKLDKGDREFFRAHSIHVALDQKLFIRIVFIGGIDLDI